MNSDNLKKELELYTYISENLRFKNNIELVYKSTLIKPGLCFSWPYIEDAWKEYKKDQKDKRVDLYVHFPFCTSICNYCMYTSKILEEGDIDNFFSILEEQADRIAKLDLKYKALSIGGGTPSILEPKDLLRLLSILSRFPLDKDGEKALEVNPASATKEKLLIAKRFGINRVSLGVHSLDPEVIAINNREFQTKEMVKRCISWIKELDMESGADIMIGLKGDTKSSFMETFRYLVDCRVDKIYAYPILINEGYLSLSMSTWQEFNEAYKNLHDEVNDELSRDYPGICHEKGIRFVHPSRFDFRDKGFAYRYGHHPKIPVAIMGLGPYSNSIIPGRMNYSLVGSSHSQAPFRKDFRLSDLIYEGEEYDEDYPKVEYIVKEIVSYYRIIKKAYEDIFSEKIEERFGHALGCLKELGIAEENDKGFDFRRMDETEYFKYLLFFVGPKKARGIALERIEQ